MKSHFPKILIIDDDEINNLICTRMVNRYSDQIEVTTVTSGAEALEILEKDAVDSPERLPNTILLDINMPLMNGWEFIDKYRKLNLCDKLDIDLYLLTSSSYYRDAEVAGKYSEVKEMFTKPLTFNILDQIESCRV